MPRRGNLNYGSTRDYLTWYESMDMEAEIAEFYEKNAFALIESLMNGTRWEKIEEDRKDGTSYWGKAFEEHLDKLWEQHRTAMWEGGEE